jgi:hypothetical protein
LTSYVAETNIVPPSLGSVTEDPALRIADIENVETVLKDGVGFDTRKLPDTVKGRWARIAGSARRDTFLLRDLSSGGSMR